MDSMLYSRAAFPGGSVAIAADAAFLCLPEVVAPQLRKLATLHTRPDGSLKTVAFETRPGFAPESYRLEITAEAATVAASDDTGLFYGAQTLMRALERAGIAPACHRRRAVDPDPRLQALSPRSG